MEVHVALIVAARVLQSERGILAFSYERRLSVELDLNASLEGGNSQLLDALNSARAHARARAHASVTTSAGAGVGATCDAGAGGIAAALLDSSSSMEMNPALTDEGGGAGIDSGSLDDGGGESNSSNKKFLMTR